MCVSKKISIVLDSSVSVTPLLKLKANCMKKQKIKECLRRLIKKKFKKQHQSQLGTKKLLVKKSFLNHDVTLHIFCAWHSQEPMLLKK